MNQESGDIPIACRLSNAKFAKRKATLLAQFKSSAITTQELRDGYTFRVPGDKKSLKLLWRLLTAERECCPFLTFELTAHPNTGPVDLRVTGPARAKDLLASIFLDPLT